MAEQRVKLIITGQDKASTKLKGVSGALGGLKSAAKALIPIIGIAGLGLAFKNVLKQTIEFESKLGDIATLISGDSTEAVNKFRKGIQELSKIVPVDPKELGSAAYQVVSAGISDTAKALEVLEEASKLGVAGLGTTEEATDLLTSALNAFQIDASDAERVAGVLFNTVKQGKTTVAELNRAFGQVAPIAAEMGVSLEELQAATAALTTSGLKTSVAQTQLRAAMSSLLKPTKEASELFERLDVVSFKQLIERSGGLVEAFNQLKIAAEGDEEALAKAAGSVEGLNAILALTGAASDSFSKTLGTMEGATNDYNEAVAKQNEQIDKQFQLLKNNLNVEMQKLAIKILPALLDVMKGLPTAIDTLFVKPFKAVTNVLGEIIFRTQQAIDLLTKVKTLGGVLPDIPSVLDVLSGKALLGGVKKVFGFADGGVVPGPAGTPVPAIVHGGERIIPNGRGAGVVVNISGSMFLDDDAAEKFGERLVRILKDNVRI